MVITSANETVVQRAERTSRDLSAHSAAPFEASRAGIAEELSSSNTVEMKDPPSQTTNVDPSKRNSKGKVDKSGKEPKEKEKAEGRVKFCKKDWTLLLDWCKIDSNFEAVKGTDKSTRVGTKYGTKRQAYADLAHHINEKHYKGSTLVKLSWETARNRFQYLEGLHKKAKEISGSTGWGLDKKDEAKGITTLEEKLEKLCPCYARVHLLFGGTPRTNLRGNTFASSCGGPSVEHVPWTAVQSGTVVDIGDSSDSSKDVVDEVDSHMTESNEDDSAMDAHGPHSDPPTPTAATQSPLPVPVSPTMSPVQAETLVQSPLPALQRITPTKSKFNKAASYPNKKRHGSDKGQSLQGAFSSGLESISVEKSKSNDIREKAYERRFQSLQADRALRSEVAQRKLDLEDKKLALEAERLTIDKLKANNEIHAALLEATMKIVNENKTRPPEELAAILKAYTAILPPLP